MNKDELSMEIGASGRELSAGVVLPSEAQMKAFWKRASTRVRVPLVICSPLVYGVHPASHAPWDRSANVVVTFILS